MTLREFLGILRRRWYVVIVVFGIAAAATLLLARDGGMYVTKTLVTFTLPDAATLMPDNGSTNESVIAFAGSVAAQVSPNGMTSRFYSRSDAPLYGVGLREAVSIGLRDEGTQWSTNYGRAVIEVEIVGRTEVWVQQQQDQALEIIEAIAHGEQAAAGVAEGQRIEVHIEPLTRIIEHIAPSRLSQLLAGAAMVGAAVLISAGGMFTLEHAAKRHKRTWPRRRSAARGETT